MSSNIHIDLIGGIAGDMFAAAMLDAFPDLEAPLRADLDRAGLAPHVALETASGRAAGLACLRVQMRRVGEQSRATPHYPGLMAMIASAPLDDVIKSRASDILTRLAEAEAAVHGVALADVHFHEIADWDSLADIVAAASLIERSGIRQWSSSAVPMGAGRVMTEHGVMPLPAPATAHLLTGLDTYVDEIEGERVTPTGAAILRHLVEDGSPRPPGRIAATGTGAGQREFPHLPNILRLLVLDASEPPAPHDRVTQLSFEIDDMTPEEMSVALDRIRLGDGVLDASFALRMGKKGRAIFAVDILARAEMTEAVADICLLETSTLGLRITEHVRHVLRRGAMVTSPAAKRAIRPDGTTTIKAESDALADTPTLRARRQLAAGVEKDREDV